MKNQLFCFGRAAALIAFSCAIALSNLSGESDGLPVMVEVADGSIVVSVETVPEQEYAVETSDDLRGWRTVKTAMGSGDPLAYTVVSDQPEVFVRFVRLVQGEVRGLVNMSITSETGFTDTATGTVALLQAQGISNTDDLFQRMGSVYQVNSMVARLQAGGEEVDTGAVLHLLREAEIRTNLQPLEEQGFRRELVDRMVRNRMDLNSLHERMQQLQPGIEPLGGGSSLPGGGGHLGMLSETGPTERQLHDHYVQLRNEMVETGPIEFSYEEFLELRDHISALEPLDPGVLQTGVQSTNIGTGLGSNEPTLSQLEMTLARLEPPTTAFVPEIIRERLMRTYIYPALPLTIIGRSYDPEDKVIAESVSAQPHATEDREPGYRHFMVNQVGMAWFVVTVEGSGVRLQIDSPDGVRVIDAAVADGGSYGFALPVFEADKGRYWRVATQSGLTLRLIDLTLPRTVSSEMTNAWIPDMPLPVPFRDNWFSGTWLRFRTHHDAAVSGRQPYLDISFHHDGRKLRSELFEPDADEGEPVDAGVPQWQTLLLADRIAVQDERIGYDEQVTLPFDSQTATYDLFFLPSQGDSGAWQFDANGQLTGANLFAIDVIRRIEPRPRFAMQVNWETVQTRSFMIGLIDEVAFSRDGESDGKKAEVKLTFNANIAPYFARGDTFATAVGDPIILDAWRAWVSMGNSAMRVRASEHRDSFDAAMVLLRSDSTFERYFNGLARAGVPIGGRLNYLWHGDNDVMRVFNRYLQLILGSTWYNAIDEAEAMYLNWQDNVVQINSFTFPYGQNYNITDSKRFYHDTGHPYHMYYHPVIPVSIPLFAVPKDRMANVVHPILSSYFGMEIDKVNRAALFGAVLKGVINAALSISTGNWAEAICDGVSMIAGIQNVLAAAEDDPIGNANFSINRASSDHGFYGMNNDRILRFQMSGYPDGNNEHMLSGAMQFAQLSCSTFSLMRATGGPLVSNPLANTQQFWQRIQAGNITDIVDQINQISAFGASIQEMQAFTEFTNHILQGRLDEALQAAAEWSTYYRLLTSGQDIFDSHSDLRDNRYELGGAASLGANLSHSEIYFHFGDYSNRKTTAKARVGLVRSVPARHIEVHFHRAHIFDLKESSSNLPAEIFVNARVGVIADKPPVSWQDVPMQYIGADGELILDNGSHSSGYQTLPNLPFVAYTKKSYPVRNFGVRGGTVPSNVIYYPQEAGSTVFNATWDEDVNTAAIFVEIGVYEDDGPRIDDDMIGVVAQTFLLEDLLKDPSSRWTQQEDGSWLLEVTDHPVYDETKLESLVRITDDHHREFQLNHNRERLLAPAALVSFSIRLELGKFVTWHDDNEYDPRPQVEPIDLSVLTPGIVAKTDLPIHAIQGQINNRILTRTGNQLARPSALQVWELTTGDQPALSLVTTLSGEAFPALADSVFNNLLDAQLAMAGDFVVVLHFNGLTAFDVRNPANITVSHFDGVAYRWPTRMAVDADDPSTLYLSYRHPEFDIDVLALTEDGTFAVIDSRSDLPDTVVGLMPLPQGGVLVHLMSAVATAPSGSSHGMDPASGWGWDYDQNVRFLTDKYLIFDDQPLLRRSNLRIMAMRQTGGAAPALLTIDELNLRGHVSGEQLAGVISPFRSSIFTPYDDQTFISNRGFSDVGFAIQIANDLFFLDPNRTNSTREVFKEVLDVKKAAIGWGFGAGSNPIRTVKSGEIWINPLVGQSFGAYILTAGIYSQLHPHPVLLSFLQSEDPISPFTVFAPSASSAAFLRGKFRTDETFFPVKDGAFRYVLVRAAEAASGFIRTGSQSTLHNQPGNLMLVDLLAPPPPLPLPENVAEIPGSESVDPFFMGLYEVTLAEWRTVVDWSRTRGYDLPNGEACGDAFPVSRISWYDAIKWCNAKSEMEGRQPAYSVAGEIFRSGEQIPDWDRNAHGYHLPSEAQWIRAFGDFMYSGSNNLSEVGWFIDNSHSSPCPFYANGAGLREGGLKLPNEFGIFDMSGNIGEWVWDADSEGLRIYKGGHFLSQAWQCTAGAISSAAPDRRINQTNGFRFAHPVPQRFERILSIAGNTDFGAIEVGLSVERVITLSNSGDGVLVIEPIQLPDGFQTDWQPYAIAPDGQLEIRITFAPPSEGTFHADLSIVSNATGGVTQITLTGEAMAPLPPPPPPQGMVLVEGGTLPGTDTSLTSFLIGQYEVTFGEWQTVRNWALSNGYPDLLSQPPFLPLGEGCTDNHPVVTVNWYDVLKWCNARSEMENLTPVYRTHDGSVYRSGTLHPSVLPGANGYRLPTPEQWQFAAIGGNASLGFLYSGSNDPDAVAWHAGNATGSACNLGTFPVGLKLPNELGIYDMSGNVEEWCWISSEDFFSQAPLRGGSWSSSMTLFLQPNRSAAANPNGRFSNRGFRIIR